jgi:hypothetical protein
MPADTRKRPVRHAPAAATSKEPAVAPRSAARIRRKPSGESASDPRAAVLVGVKDERLRRWLARLLDVGTALSGPEEKTGADPPQK